MLQKRDTDYLTHKISIILIEDDFLHQKTIKDTITEYAQRKDLDIDLSCASSALAARALLKNNKFDLGFFDLWLHSKFVGIQLIKQNINNVDYPVIVSDDDLDDTIKEGYKVGCKDFISKSSNGDDSLENRIKLILDRFLMIYQSEHYQQLIRDSYITQDEETIQQLNKIPTYVSNYNPIFIGGESGTGKEVVAKLIQLILRPNGKLIDFNAAQIQPTLAEGTLFGHKKGAFTGATSDHDGYFKLADGGILFIDEIGKMPMDLQYKLLKVIEQKSFKALGDDKLTHSNFRLVTATSENLEKLIAEGIFSNDLYQRIIGNTIQLKPLREKSQDIELLINHFIRNHTSGRMMIVEQSAIDLLEKHHWSGNIRELKFLVERWHSESRKVIKRKDISLSASIAPSVSFISHEMIEHAHEHGFKSTIDEVKKKLLKYCLSMNKNSVGKTAKMLNINRNMLYRSNIVERLQ